LTPIIFQFLLGFKGDWSGKEEKAGFFQFLLGFKRRGLRMLLRGVMLTFNSF